MKIAVYSIAKNEARQVEGWASAAADADYRIIVDTGSTDATIDVAKAYGVDVSSVVVEPFSFGDARNLALAAIPEDADWCVSVDLDERLLPGWREALESAITEQPHVDRFEYDFIGNRTSTGEVSAVWRRDLIHRRQGFVWRWPIHEYLEDPPGAVHGFAPLLMEHLQDVSKDRSDRIGLLAAAYEKDPTDSRMAFYYGRDLHWAGRSEMAYVVLKGALALDGWVWERSESMRILAACRRPEAEVWLLRAAAETPDRREPFVDLAQLYCDEGRWAPALGAAVRALDMGDTPHRYIRDVTAWNHRPWDVAALSAHRLGLRDVAVRCGKEAVRLAPEDERLRTNLRFYLAGE